MVFFHLVYVSEVVCNAEIWSTIDSVDRCSFLLFLNETIEHSDITLSLFHVDVNIRSSCRSILLIGHRWIRQLIRKEYVNLEGMAIKSRYQTIWSKAHSSHRLVMTAEMLASTPIYTWRTRQTRVRAHISSRLVRTRDRLSVTNTLRIVAKETECSIDAFVRASDITSYFY